MALLAQTPQALKYQAVARDGIGNVLTNRAVSFRISILQGSASGSTTYSETHSKTTNGFGLVDLEIGHGTPVSGSFSGINWGSTVYFVKVEMDPNGGSSYLLMGTSQLLSVPYALLSKRAEIGDGWGSQNVITDATLSGNGATSTPLKIADNGVNSSKITDGSIVAADIANSAITTDKINPGAVTGAMIAQASATAGQALKWTGTTWAPSDDALGGLTLPFSGSVTTGGISFQITCNGGQGLTSKGWGIGLLGEAESSQGVGVFGVGTTGVSGVSSSETGIGLRGSVSATNGINYGVYGYTASTSGFGVYGLASASTGATYGMRGASYSSSGVGVHGSATSSSGTNYGVYGVSESSTGLGVYGIVTSTTGNCYGVRGQSNSSTGFGVVGHASSSTGINYGVKGQTMSPDGYGVHGMNYATSGLAIGVYGDTQSSTGIGVYGATASSGNGKAIYGVANSTGYAGYFLGGQVYIDTKLGIGKGATYTLDVVGTANLNNGIPSGVALRCNGDEAIWYNGTYFSWGFGGTINYFKDPVGIDCFPGDGHLLAVNGVASKPGGGTWASFSDIRLKDIHGQYIRGLGDIIRLQPVRFSYKAGNKMNLPSDKEYVGFIAQEVRKIFPEAITETTSGFLEFDMHSVNVAMVNAIKELKAENDRLNDENSQIKARLAKVEQFVEEIKSEALLSKK